VIILLYGEWHGEEGKGTHGQVLLDPRWRALVFMLVFITGEKAKPWPK